MRFKNSDVNLKIEYNLDIENARLEKNLRSGVFLLFAKFVKHTRHKKNNVENSNLC